MSGTTISICVFAFLIATQGNSVTGHPRIVGGYNATIKHFPYLVSLRSFGEHFCGGTIISERHILTAAHCVDKPSTIFTLTIHSGTSKKHSKGTVHLPLEIFVHPGYNRFNRNIYDDFAMITLKDPINFDKYQQKIELPKQDVQFHQVGYVIGWGRDKSSGWHFPEQLQKLQVALLPSDKCQPFIPRQLHQSQVCLFRRLGTGPCHGDSGGPLVRNREIIGIASYVYQGNCAANVPAVYTNVFAYKDLIESIMNKKL